MPLSRDVLVGQLQTLGLESGDLVMVHASLRKVGPIEGGAATLIGAVTDAVGANGTMLMVIAADDSEPFDAKTTEVDTDDMGILAEVFRTSPGTRVSDHPAARFAALGPLAEELTSNPPLHHYFSTGSPLERFVERRGRVLRLGANIDTVTLTHLAEYRANVADKIHVSRRYLLAEGGEQWIDSLDDTDGIATWHRGDYFSQILLDYFAAGLARHGAVGSCTADLIDGVQFVEYAVAWMERELGRGTPS